MIQFVVLMVKLMLVVRLMLCLAELKLLMKVNARKKIYRHRLCHQNLKNQLKFLSLRSQFFVLNNGSLFAELTAKLILMNVWQKKVVLKLNIKENASKIEYNKKFRFFIE